MSEKTPEYWRGVDVGDQITVNDEQAIKDSMEQGRGAKGLEYTVRRIQVFEVADGAGEYRLFYLQEEGEQSLFLLAKIVDEEIDLRLFFGIGDFESGDRQEMLDTDRYWLFNEPEDPDNFDVLTLEYNDELISPDDVPYAKKMTLHGFGVNIPPQSGIDDEFQVSITEYSTAEKVDNEELLVIEEGGNERGGFISLYAGTEVNELDVEVFHVDNEDEEDDEDYL